MYVYSCARVCLGICLHVLLYYSIDMLLVIAVRCWKEVLIKFAICSNGLGIVDCLSLKSI